jgi:hypothetical protein
MLTACGQKDAGKQEDAAEVPAEDSAEETQTISGVINRLDDYLVLLDDSAEYHVFDFGEEVDKASLEEGDSVNITYTGTLDSENPSPVAIAVEKAG